jgi:sec-independent protein translocase protein TatC
MESGLQDTINKYYPYLAEIRKRLMFVAAIFIAASVLGFFYFEKVLKFALTYFKLEGSVGFTSPFQFLELSVNSAVLVGSVVIFPIIIIQLLSFLKPALRNKEFRTVLAFVPFSIILFIIGFAYGIFIMRYVVVMFKEKSVLLALGSFIDVSKFLSQMLSTSALLGLAFQYPIVLSVLMRLKVLKYEVVKKQRLWAYLGSLFFAMILPPTDLYSLVLLTVPLVILFEITLLLNRFVHKTT